MPGRTRAIGVSQEIGADGGDGFERRLRGGRRVGNTSEFREMMQVFRAAGSYNTG